MAKWKEIPTTSAPIKWQPIETAPKTGFFLVCSWRDENIEGYECSICVVWPNNKGELFAYLNEDDEELFYLDGPATHWMPLPEPPAGEDRG